MNKTLHIHVAAEEEWKGRLRFDIPRHRQTWGMPLEYPRVNGSPEWYVVDPESFYLITDVLSGESALYSGKELSEGYALSLGGSQGKTSRLTVSAQAR